MSGQLARSFLIKTFLSVYSSRQELTEGPLLSEESCVPEKGLLFGCHPSQAQLAERIPWDHPFLDLCLKWWTTPSNVIQGNSPRVSVPQLNIFTDAFTHSWGAHYGRWSATGKW